MEGSFQRNFGHSRDIFGLSHTLRNIIPERDRLFVYGRIRSYLFNRRRGNLKLPTRFGHVLQLFVGLSKTQIRDMAFEVSPHNCHRFSLSRREMDYCKQQSAVTIWNPPRKVSWGEALEVERYRLPITKWPRIAGDSWPSTPTFGEMLVKTRSGKSCTGFSKPDTIENGIRRSDMNDIRIATWVVSNNIIGVRAHPNQIPRKFLPWFRYCRGILFLTVRYSIPAGLVRKLLAVWKTNPKSLWLLDNCCLKYYLRSTPRPVLPVKEFSNINDTLTLLGYPQSTDTTDPNEFLTREELLAMFDSE